MTLHVALASAGHPLAHAPTQSALPWWSFGKTVLAAAALALVRDGLLELDAELADGPFSLRQLLRHQAGLADYGELADYHAAVASQAAPWPAEEMLQRLDASRLRYPPGQGWRYSNVGYLYVARLLERVTDLPLDAALQRCVLAPLGLTQVRLARRRADWGHGAPPDMIPPGSTTACWSARWTRPRCCWSACWAATSCRRRCCSRCARRTGSAARLPGAPGWRPAMAWA